MDETSQPDMPVEALLQRITEAFDTLPRQLKSIASYIDENRSSVMMDRTSDIA
ncbi:MurR/RpiR family transcriptional regulator, partial [Burkholderia gladioli]|nr:MurR/RpiR family transcriptional regulator [Burkholderia gladioli]